MTASELLKLIDAGFTVEDLRPMLAASDEQPPSDPPADPPADPPNDPPADPPAPTDRLDRIEELIEQMAGAIIKGTEANDPKEERDNGLKGLLEGM